ncbi:hypothetical protein FALBO_8804 [Fusarium albosuccineum]|uniref:Uncharacterized protein n=1 Tax=Fusarium albosuccineum TaxID=1237068 RepID=A0A8H4P9L9_9HYPO|nr:hypothetical protein FALBO_8804 [Fusarium albosuccineum]
MAQNDDFPDELPENASGGQEAQFVGQNIDLRPNNSTNRQTIATPDMLQTPFMSDSHQFGSSATIQPSSLTWETTSLLDQQNPTPSGQTTTSPFGRSRSERPLRRMIDTDQTQQASSSLLKRVTTREATRTRDSREPTVALTPADKRSIPQNTPTKKGGNKRSAPVYLSDEEDSESEGESASGQKSTGDIDQDHAADDKIVVPTTLTEAKASSVGNGSARDRFKVGRDINSAAKGQKKDDIPVSVYEQMIAYAFRKLHLDHTTFPNVFKYAVEYISGTNLFTAKNWSSWSGQKAAERATALVNSIKCRYPDYVITIPPTVTLAMIAATDLVESLVGASGNTVEAVKEMNAYGYAHIAIHVVEASLTEKDKLKRNWAVCVGRRPSDEPKPEWHGPKRPKKKRERVIPEADRRKTRPGPMTATVPEITAGQRYPYREQPLKFTRTMTASEWEAKNQHWLNQLGRRAIEQSQFRERILAEVTEHTAPLINEDWRDKLDMWFATTDPKSKLRRLWEVPQQASLQIECEELPQIRREPDHVRHAIREIESAALELPGKHKDIAKRIKAQTDTLFAYRDHEINQTDQHIARVEMAMTTRHAPAVTFLGEMTDSLDQAETARDKCLAEWRKDMDQAAKIHDIQPDDNKTREELEDILRKHMKFEERETYHWRLMARAIIGETGWVSRGEGPSCYAFELLLQQAEVRGGNTLRALCDMERWDRSADINYEALREKYDEENPAEEDQISDLEMDN